MDALRSFFFNFAENHLVFLGGVALLVVIIVMGFAFLGPRETKDWAKKQALWIIAAGVCIYLAEPIAREIVETLGGVF